MLKGQAKADYQREYMRGYMREKRAKERKWRVHLRSPLVIKKETVKTQSVKTPKMGFEAIEQGLLESALGLTRSRGSFAQYDADGNAMPGD